MFVMGDEVDANSTRVFEEHGELRTQVPKKNPSGLARAATLDRDHSSRLLGSIVRPKPMRTQYIKCGSGNSTKGRLQPKTGALTIGIRFWRIFLS